MMAGFENIGFFRAAGFPGGNRYAYLTNSDYTQEVLR